MTMISDTAQLGYHPIPVDCPATVRFDGVHESAARVKTMSARGLELRAERDIRAGTWILIKVLPVGRGDRPLFLTASVTRCHPTGGAYAIGCVFT